MPIILSFVDIHAENKHQFLLFFIAIYIVDDNGTFAQLEEGERMAKWKWLSNVKHVFCFVHSQQHCQQPSPFFQLLPAVLSSRLIIVSLPTVSPPTVGGHSSESREGGKWGRQRQTFWWSDEARGEGDGIGEGPHHHKAGMHTIRRGEPILFLPLRRHRQRFSAVWWRPAQKQPFPQLAALAVAHNSQQKPPPNSQSALC